MKAIPVTCDDHLLARLDRDGRSAVLTRAAELYLRQRRAGSISAAYRRADADHTGREAEFAGWEKERKWPAE